ncbi:MAG: SDR family NAD(P)-dependent oxidoreductase [Proteobacteria bacterium]|nr:SDR family NAD(P)-dependent oxidoreductase [Pseudomonadota bacterium]
MSFTDKTIVVTGGTGALGTAVVGLLTDAGARCIVPYRNEVEAQRYVHRGTKSVTMVAAGDLADEDVVGKIYDGLKLWASIHIAGGFAMGAIEDTDKAALMAQLDGNLVSCFLCCRAAVKAIKAAGQVENSGGRIVNVAARPALEPRSGAGMTAYTIAKSGVSALSAALGEEVAKDGILVNAVAPSIMDTAANRKAMPKADFAKWPKVEDVAATIVYLASPDNAVARGGVVPVYGRS